MIKHQPKQCTLIFAKHPPNFPIHFSHERLIFTPKMVDSSWPPAPRQNKNYHILHSFSHLKSPFGCMIQMKYPIIVLDLFVGWMEKTCSTPKMVVFHGDKSNGIESAKNHQQKQIQVDSSEGMFVFFHLKDVPHSKSVQPRVVYCGRSLPPKKGDPQRSMLFTYIYLP